jgi:predicted NAD/FAD-dependent oxidoreductase
MPNSSWEMQTMKPIVIVGAGLAGVAAAMELRRLRVPCLLLDEAASPGGRSASLRGDGWVADPSIPWVDSGDVALVELIRSAGLEAELVALQGAVMHYRNGQIVQVPSGVPRTLRAGFECFFDHSLTVLPRPVLGTFVAAIRWIAERQVFLFRDGRTGATLAHPITRSPIEGSGVVLAVPPRRAAGIAAQSRVLLPMAEALGKMPAQPGASAVFVVPRIDVPWSALMVDDHWALRLLVREEAKSPGRVDADKSVLVAQATPAVANARYEKDCIRILYDSVREILPQLPEQAMETRLIAWEEGIGAEPLEMVTDPAGAPVAIAMQTGDGSAHERLVRAGTRAARVVAGKL